MSERDQELQVHDVHAMVGAYATDALDDDERALFEQHLTACESCRRESEEFAETLGELGWLAETTPPPLLRASVLAEIATVRPLPPLDPPEERTVPRPWPAEIHAKPPSGSTAQYGAPGADELAARRQRRLRRALIGVVAAALVLVVGLGGWVVSLVGEQRQQQVASQQVSDLLTAPDAKVYTTELNGASVSYVVSKQRNQALFLGHGVQDPGGNKTYQLWTISGESATSQGLTGGGTSVVQWFSAPVANADAMAVTVEPAGGSPAPTTTPLAVVKL